MRPSTLDDCAEATHRRMFDRFKELFSAEEVEALPVDPEERVRIATCVVLLEVARVDEDFSEDERRRILDILRKRYALSDDDALELMQASTESRGASVDLWSFTNQLNQHCSTEEKIQVVEEVWRVVVADGGIHGHESHFMRQLGKLLNLPPRDIIDAKVKVLNEARGGES